VGSFGSGEGQKRGYYRNAYLGRDAFKTAQQANVMASKQALTIPLYIKHLIQLNAEFEVVLCPPCEKSPHVERSVLLIDAKILDREPSIWCQIGSKRDDIFKPILHGSLGTLEMVNSRHENTYFHRIGQIIR
jgi:hypothetical protein